MSITCVVWLMFDCVCSSKEYVWCVCDPSMGLGVPPYVRLCVCMRGVISEFNSEIEGSHASCVLKLFLCSILCLICFFIITLHQILATLLMEYPKGQY